MGHTAVINRIISYSGVYVYYFCPSGLYTKKGRSLRNVLLLCLIKRLGSLCSLEGLGAIVEEGVSGPEQNYAYYVDQPVHGEAGDDLPSDEYADAAADEVAQSGNGIVTTLLDEYYGVSGHQQSAGAHEYGEAGAGGAAEEQAGCHAGSIQTEADVHESAPYYVQDNCYPELPLVGQEASAFAYGTEGTEAVVLAEHDDSGSDHGAAQPNTDLVDVPLGDDLSECISADHSGYTHCYQEDGFALYAGGEDQSLEDNGEGIADVQGAGDVDIFNVLEGLVEEGGRSEGTAAEGIEEVCEDTYEHALCPLLAASFLELALVVLVDVYDQHASDAYEADSQDDLKSQYH